MEVRFLKAPQLRVARTDDSTVVVAIPTPSGDITSYEYKVDGGSWTSASGASQVTLTGQSGTPSIGLRATGGGGASAIGAGDVSALTVPSQPAAPSGVAMVGSRLTAPSIQGKTITAYQWYADGTLISGATSSSYVVKSQDEGKKISLDLTYNETTGASPGTVSSSVTLRSVDTSAIAPFAPTSIDAPLGLAAVGQTLTVEPNAATTATGVTRTFQWKATPSGGSALNVGSNAASYTVGAGDAGKTISVDVTYKSADNATIATVTSAATAAVAPVAPTFTGTAQVGAQLSATPATGGTSYQWLAWTAASGGSSTMVGSCFASMPTTLVLTEAELNAFMALEAYSDASCRGTSSSSTRSAQVAAFSPLSISAPTGDAAVGSRLTVASDATTAVPGVTRSLQWQAAGVDIAGATGSTLLLTEAQEDDTITVTATYRAADGSLVTTVVSAATVPVAPFTPAAISAPSGTAMVGSRLTVSAATSVAGITVSYQWKSGTDNVGTDTDSYIPVSGDTGKAISVVVTYRNGSDVVATKTSAPTDPVQVFAPTAISPPSGTAQVGQVLTVASDAATAATGVTRTFQWTANNVDISGETGSTFTVTPAQEGQQVRVKVAYTSAGAGSPFTTVTSAPSTSVLPPAPVVGTQPDDTTVVAGSTATFTVVATGAGSLSYQWQTRINSADLTWVNVTGGSGATTASYTTPALQGSDSGRQYRVQVSNSGGTTDSNAATVSVTIAPGPPGPPTVLASDASATVTVAAPNSGSAPASYLVTAFTASNVSAGSCTVTTPATSCTVLALTNGTTYTFSSTATNAAGTSSASVASAPVMPLATPGLPGTPRVVVTSTTSATVTVTPPSSGGPASSYTVTAVGTNPVRSCTVVAPLTSCEVTGLTLGTSYTFTTTASSVGGTSSASTASSSVNFAAPGIPGTPTVVSGPGSVTVTVPAGPGGTASSYTVTAWDPNNASVGSCTVIVPASSCVVAGLTSGTAYTFTATATSGVGTSSASSASASVTPTATIAPGVPGTPTAAVGNGQAVVTVTPPSSGGAPQSYTVTSSPGGRTCIVLSSSPTLSCTVTGLTNGVSYTFSTTATNSMGSSGSSTGSSPSAVPVAGPGAPGVPRAVVTSSTTATVTVTPPTSGGGVAAYTVTSVPAGGSCVVTAPATSCVVSGLTAGTSYEFTTTATNVWGTSSASATASAVVLSASGVPGKATVTAGAGSARVTVVPPANGGTPTTYTVTSVPAGGSCVVTAPATSCVVADLDPGTSYTFTVTGVNGIGSASGASVASDPVTPLAAVVPGKAARFLRRRRCGTLGQKENISGIRYG